MKHYDTIENMSFLFPIISISFYPFSLYFSDLNFCFMAIFNIYLNLILPE